MPTWASHNIGRRIGRTSEEEAERTRLAQVEKRDREREEWLSELTRRFARRNGVSAEVARKHINAIAVSARPRREGGDILALYG
jgi:hypothetical protein